MLDYYALFAKEWVDLDKFFVEPLVENLSPQLAKFYQGLYSTGNYPRLNYYRSDIDKSYYIEATIPGLTKSDISIEWDKDYLTIKYDKSNKVEKNNHKYYVREIHQSSFSRGVWIPKYYFDIDTIKATVENGLLKIRVQFNDHVLPNKKNPVQICIN
jgi:HSP20 family protein